MLLKLAVQLKEALQNRKRKNHHSLVVVSELTQQHKSLSHSLVVECRPTERVRRLHMFHQHNSNSHLACSSQPSIGEVLNQKKIRHFHHLLKRSATRIKRWQDSIDQLVKKVNQRLAIQLSDHQVSNQHSAEE